MLKELFDLHGRTALITGGSKGLGKAIAVGFAEAGADVMITARTEAELKTAAQEIDEAGDGNVAWSVADMTDRSAVDRLGREALERFGNVDIFVNNAGSNVPQPLVEITDEAWDQIVELNLTSGVRLARMLAPGMIERNWGRILHMSSVMALASNAARGSYSATKAALLGLARAHALELGPHDITVNCIAPGPIMTDLPMSVLTDEQKQRFAEITAVKRWGDPRDIVGPALLLATEAGRNITGTVILVDGGLICRTFD